MDAINIRTLKHETGQVMNRVALGESLQITRHKEVVAVLHPPGPAAEENHSLSRFPDFAQRVESLFGGRCLEPDATTLLAEDRADR